MGGSAGLSLTEGASNAKTVGDLSGLFTTDAVTAAEVGGGTANTFAGTSPHGFGVGGEGGLVIGVQDSTMFGASYSTPVAGVSCP